MRAKKAKKLKKSIYGDTDLKERKYIKNPETGQIIEIGHRKQYRVLKELYKNKPELKKSL